MSWIRGADGNWLWDPESQGDLTLLDQRKMAHPDEFTAEINRQEAANNAATFPDPANNVEDLRKEQKSIRNAKQQPAQQPVNAEEAAFRRLKAGHGTDADVAMFKDWTAEQLKARGFGPKSIAYFMSLHGGLNDQTGKAMAKGLSGVGKAITTGLSSVSGAFSALNGKKQPTKQTLSPEQQDLMRTNYTPPSWETPQEPIEPPKATPEQEKAMEEERAAFRRLKAGHGTDSDVAIFKDMSPQYLEARGFGPDSIAYFNSIRSPAATDYTMKGTRKMGSAPKKKKQEG